MDEQSLQDSFACLGLNVDASREEVERAFLELRSLYSEATLATYSLLDDAERQEKLDTLHKAYDLIKQSYTQAQQGAKDLEAAEETCPVEPMRVSVDADWREEPGLFLQQSRQALGLSLQDVAERTKVRSSLLQSIEEQRFDFLPAPVYLRGFVREFARMVKAPKVGGLVDAFMQLYENSRQG